MDDEDIEQVPFPKDDLMELLAGMYAESPRFLEKIAPRGWYQSAYGRLYANALDEQYSLYREGRVLDYLDFRLKHPKKSYNHTPLVPLSEFRKSYFPTTGEPIKEAFALLVLILIKLTDLSSIIHRTSNERCSVEFKQIDDVLDEFVKTTGLLPAGTDKKIELLDLWGERTKHDFYPFYEVAFRALKSLGYKWYYLDADLYSIAFMQDEYRELSLGVSSPYSADTPETMAESITEILMSYKAGDVNPLDFERIFEIIAKRKTPEDVLAYLHVYGDFPEGYPMKMTDYMF